MTEFSAAHREPRAVRNDTSASAADVDLVVSIVHFRTPALLASCLESLAPERADLALDVTVTDNASGPGSLDEARTRFPWVRFVENARNLGFGRAHNTVLAAATARHLLVLNPDTEVCRGSLKLLVDYLDSNPEVGVVGPRLRHPDGSTQPSRRRFPTLATFFLESTQIAHRLAPANPAIRRYLVADRSDDETQDVDWLVGACLCVRAAAIADVGLFDERFFLYSEEVDWCRRFRAAGWRVVYEPRAEVVHAEGASSQQDLLARDSYFQVSRLRYLEKWHGRAAARLFQAYLVLEYAVRALEESAKLALCSRASLRRERLRVIAGALRHVIRA